MNKFMPFIRQLKWLIPIALLLLATRLLMGGDAQSKVHADAHPRRVYFPNFVMNFPQGYLMEMSTTTPLIGQGVLMFMTTWPEFGSIPAEQSLAIMREKDWRKNRRMDVFIETELATPPNFRHNLFDTSVSEYIRDAHRTIPYVSREPGLVKLDMIPGLKGYGRDVDFLQERAASHKGLPFSDTPGIAVDTFFSQGSMGHVERIIYCTPRIFDVIPDDQQRLSRLSCTHRFNIDELSLSVKVHYHRDFVQQWRDIEENISALIRENIVTRMQPCHDGEDPCHCAIRFQSEYSRWRHELSKSYPFDPNNPNFDSSERCKLRPAPVNLTLK